MWETPISFTFLLHHLLGPRCWSYPCDWSCIMPMSILKPAWKEKEQKWRASYFLLSKFHLQSHSITEELVSWQHALQGRLGSLISTWLAHTLLKLHYQGKWEKWSWAQLATCQRWKREFVGSCNQKNSGLQVQFDPGFQTVSPNLSLSLSLSPFLRPGSSVLTFSSVQFSSVTQSCPTLCNPMDCSMPGFHVHHQLPELAQMIDFMLKHLWAWNCKGCIFSGPHPVGNIFPIIF